MKAAVYSMLRVFLCACIYTFLTYRSQRAKFFLKSVSTENIFIKHLQCFLLRADLFPVCIFCSQLCFSGELEFHKQHCSLTHVFSIPYGYIKKKPRSKLSKWTGK